MTSASCDLSGAVNFDLARGQVALEGAPARVLVPGHALVVLCQRAGGEAVRELGREMGKAMAARIMRRLRSVSSGDEAFGALPHETVVNHLAGELAVVGLGMLSLERWGKAAVWVIDQSPLGAHGDALYEAVLEAALAILADRTLRIIRLQRQGEQARFLLVSDIVAPTVGERLAAGEPWPLVLAALQGEGL